MNIDFMAAAEPDGRDIWRYRRIGTDTPVEIALWGGQTHPALRSHFHEEAQLTFVASGCRCFSVAGQVIEVREGEFVLIPPSVLHAATHEASAGTVSFNLYLPRSILAAIPQRAEIYTMPPHWANARAVGLHEILELLEERVTSSDHRDSDRSGANALRRHITSTDATIKHLAAASGFSREGYTRLFSRAIGIAPSRYRLLHRLNEARALLRKGEAVASVASDTGFADQSHLGRHFLAAFGTTPRSYRDG
ncbi:helix-turn-helix transcriptional regulator [Burkholderia sp. L27(2015)]|uniref:AraC family transcriptional regulator n=1 Tax=Burkholderia sp. L27(2015) TaxID=1641858 RepID=UPI00131A987B|nr:helix-turn-helix transcriptional regulator [Burkholderia sp. L27(2015)]